MINSSTVDMHNNTNLSLPKIACFAIVAECYIYMDDMGEIKSLTKDEAKIALLSATTPILVCYKNNIERQLDMQDLRCIDILELWAFVRPATFCLPTISGICETLKMDSPTTSESQVSSLLHISGFLLNQIRSEAGRPYIGEMIASMGKAGWNWSPMLLNTLNLDVATYRNKPISAGMDIWNRRSKHHDRPQPPKAGNTPVDPQEARKRLSIILSSGAEDRPGQSDYASALAGAFCAGAPDQDPTVVLAEAGTGVGKTLGYIAPATLWAENNDAPVWISTYTRNLQHQIYNEMKRLYTDPKELYQKVVIVKGRENYVCLSRFEILVRRASTTPNLIIALGLLARWLEYSSEGDLQGLDFPAWLGDIIDKDRNILSALVIKRDFGESHANCNHADKCFVDLPMKRAPYADIVITNHAFVLHRSAVGRLADDNIHHFIFDEGHHLFNSADNAFSSTLSAREAERLRRFIIKNDNGDMLSGSSGSSLVSMVTDTLGTSGDAQKNIFLLTDKANSLPDIHWESRLTNGTSTIIGEQFLSQIGKFIYAQNLNDQRIYSMECMPMGIAEETISLAKQWADDLKSMIVPAKKLILECETLLEVNSDTLETVEKKNINQLIRTIEYRVLSVIESWHDMLMEVGVETPEGLIDRLFIDRFGAQDVDIGMMRHVIDPMQYFMNSVVRPSRGCAITSASLTDTADGQDDWNWAEMRCGTQHLPSPAIRTKVTSPFDYTANTKVIIVNDVNQKSTSEIAGAYKALFESSKGGALGIFTAINKLKEVGQIIRPTMAKNGIEVYAQHLDLISMPSLIDIFRANINSCLLGTDAVRDGLDVPGESLRLIVFDRMPWTRPDIVHSVRRKHFGKTAYDNALVRAKIKQAFGRLIRSENDSGVFVILQPLPSRMQSAFPEGVSVETMRLKDACDAIKNKVFNK